MSTSAPLQAFVEDELVRSAALIERCVADTLRLLRDRRETLAAPAGEHRAELSEALQRHAARFQASFLAALRHGVRAEMSWRDDAAAAAPGASPAPALALMDESRVEAEIELSRAIQLIDGTAEWERRELQTFTSTLAGQSHVSEESNPLRPAVYASALWEAAGAVTQAPAARAALMRAGAGVLAGLLKTAWAAASSRLEASGVQPSQYRTVRLTPGTATSREGSPHAAARGGALIALLDRARPGVPASLDPAPDPDGRIAALLSRLFAAIRADAGLPGAMGAVLARLQGAILRLALADRSLLETLSHPAWLLLDRLAAASRCYPVPSDRRLATLVAFCDALAQELSRAELVDEATFRRALARVDAFLGEQRQWQLREAAEAVLALQRAERRDLLQSMLAQRLAEQMATAAPPSAVRRFMIAEWSRVLAEAMVRFGEQAEATVGYVQAVDDLLWSLRPPDAASSRRRLVAMLPGLLQRLRSGMALVELPEPQQLAFIEALMPLHAEALRPGSRPAEPTLTPEQIVQRLREEVVHDDAAPRPFSDSVIDLASMQTVPADFLATDIGTPQDAAQHVDALRPGERRRLFIGARWSCVQLLWRSERGLYLLFAGEQPGRTHSITRRALERLDAAGLLRPLEDKALVQRAVDTLADELALPN